MIVFQVIAELGLAAKALGQGVEQAPAVRRAGRQLDAVAGPPGGALEPADPHVIATEAVAERPAIATG